MNDEDDRKRAIKFLEKKERKPKRKRNRLLVIGVFLILIGAVYVAIDIKDRYEVVGKVGTIALNVEGFNRVEISNPLFYWNIDRANDGWFRVKITLCKTNAPWENEDAYIWYNIDTDAHHLERL